VCNQGNSSISLREDRMDKRDVFNVGFGILMLAILAGSCYELFSSIGVWSAVNFR
jgi:hypothetical protein